MIYFRPLFGGLIRAEGQLPRRPASTVAVPAMDDRNAGADAQSRLPTRSAEVRNTTLLLAFQADPSKMVGQCETS